MIIQSSKVLNHNEGLISQKKICSHSRKLRQLCGGCPDFFFYNFPNSSGGKHIKNNNYISIQQILSAKFMRAESKEICWL